MTDDIPETFTRGSKVTILWPMLIREEEALRLSECGQACHTDRLGCRFKKVCNVHSRGGRFCKGL